MSNLEDSFRNVLEDFTKRLTNQELETFKLTSLQDLQDAVGKIQAEQAARRESMNMTRIRSFLEAAEQFGSVVEVFLNTTEFLAFVWGPMKFLLVTASTCMETFDTLLDAYVSIGERMPLLRQYREIFQNTPHMTKVLEMIYADILKFHRMSLRVFTLPKRKQFLRSMWKNFNARFQHILEDLDRHHELIVSSASMSHFQQYQLDRDSMLAKFDRRWQKQAEEEYAAVAKWIVAADCLSDQNFAEDIRREYPKSGSWILHNPGYINWSLGDVPRRSITWINGIPGAGKTVLTSFIIKNCQNYQSSAVAYFYCKHNDPQKRTCMAVLKSLLSQLIFKDMDHITFYYDRYLTSGQLNLVSEALCKELLEIAVANLPRVYMCIDGLDECDRRQRTLLMQELNGLAQRCDSQAPGRLRILLTSRNEPDVKKGMLLSQEIQLTVTENENDIKSFVRVQCQRIQEKFELDDDLVEHLLERTCSMADGMFLFANLVMQNLFDQPTLASFWAEIEPNRFPKGLDQAYERVLDRIYKNPNSHEADIARKVLGWMVCAKRPLKWHEIQAALSIDTQERTVEIHERKSRVHIREICGSLVNELNGDRLELVHGTATRYLVIAGHINSNNVERELASLTLQYLTFECFEHTLKEPRRTELIHQGYTAFQDYAVIHWLDHLQAVLRGDSTLLMEQELEGLGPAIVEFADWTSPGDDVSSTGQDLSIPAIFPDRQKITESFQYCDFYPALCVVLAQASRHMARGADAFDQLWLEEYDDIVVANRQALEKCLSPGIVQLAIQKDLRAFYGEYWFKCPKATCFFFHEGFQDSRSRAHHVNRHERPFRCTVPECSGFRTGFVAAKDLDKHLKIYHPEKDQLAVSFARIRKSKDKDKGPKKPPKPPKHPANFQCHLCPKKFTRAFNLRAHIRTHTDERPFVCSVCGKMFARQHDQKRHGSLHSGEKNFVCKGELELQPGTMWGCGSRFARPDSLGEHFRSETGQSCIKPLIEEEQQRRQQQYQHQRGKTRNDAQNEYSLKLAGVTPVHEQPEALPDNSSLLPLNTAHNYLPASLLAQFPDLQKIDWSQIPQESDAGPDPYNEGADAEQGNPEGHSRRVSPHDLDSSI